ncbi:hypothetical protein NSP_34070 [Nodularia spumigena CCY9414]|nr:hypothetical protein NSP_34070 [Nodularia spumigena CCY9414]
MRGNGYEKQSNIALAAATALPTFPSPCGEMVMKNASPD